jgi:hypothetical protein
MRPDVHNLLSANQSQFSTTTTCGEHPPALKRQIRPDLGGRAAGNRQISGSFQGL